MLILGALCSLAAGAAQPAEPVKVERTETVSATVESIDLDKRLVELRSRRSQHDGPGLA